MKTGKDSLKNIAYLIFMLLHVQPPGVKKTITTIGTTRHVFARVRQFCTRFGVQVFGFSVYKKTYDEVVPENFRHFGGDYYTWALRHVLVKIHEWRQAKRIKDPIEHIFDWQEIGDPIRDEIEDLVGQYTEFHGEIHHDF